MLSWWISQKTTLLIRKLFANIFFLSIPNFFERISTILEYSYSKRKMIFKLSFAKKKYYINSWIKILKENIWILHSRLWVYQNVVRNSHAICVQYHSIGAEAKCCYKQGQFYNIYFLARERPLLNDVSFVWSFLPTL